MSKQKMNKILKQKGYTWKTAVRVYGWDCPKKGFNPDDWILLDKKGIPTAVGKRLGESPVELPSVESFYESIQCSE